MVSTEAVAAINAEQLVTPTDRLLHGAVRRAPFAPSPFAPFADEPTVCVRPARESIASSPVLMLVVAAAATWLAVAASCLLP